MGEEVLVLGGGGREHTLAWKLAESPQVQHVYVAPGNAGTDITPNITNIVLDVSDHAGVAGWCRDHGISLVVIGPEAPLADGFADSLNAQGINCFGPSAKAAEIESSKQFAKDFMKRWNIPTARYDTFTEADQAEHFINIAPYRALVVKASGLAAGKGVIVAGDQTEACKAARDIIQNQLFGSAGDTVVIEELLEGEEISCLAFTDGDSIYMMPPAQDYKRLEEGGSGPNTGGMGAYCPCPLVNPCELELIRTDILQRAVDGLKADGRPYQGVLYAGLMLTTDGPKVLEFNCRFGDPETQVLMPLLESDLYDVLMACVKRTLHTITPKFYSNKSAVAVVTVARGYPNKYNKGMLITGIDEVETRLQQTVFHAGTKSLGPGEILTNGGRVLAVVAVDSSLLKAANRAIQGADTIQYDGKVFRRDIASNTLTSSRLTYSDSGVSIAAGDALVDSIKSIVHGTTRPGCMGDLGMFGAGFDLKKAGYIDPLLVSGTDGVGTKLKIAQQCEKHSTIGIDLVAMCVNDVLCHGAEPLYFLDYFACGKLEVGVASDVVKGIAIGCKQAGCALIGGETAEMPGMYEPGEYDIAGFTVGAVERTDYLPYIHTIQPGDHVLGLASSGIHSNGYSLVRKVVQLTGLQYTDQCPFHPHQTLGEALLTPTQIYVKSLLSLVKNVKVKAIAHITGGGLPGNISRILPEGASVVLDANTWHVPPVFRWIAQQGNIEDVEMSRTFNCGVGMVVVIDKTELPQTVCDRLTMTGSTASHIGCIRPRQPDEEAVVIKDLSESLRCDYTVRHSPAVNGLIQPIVNGLNPTNGVKHKKRVGILISGSGTNMKALLDYTKESSNQASCEISLVISNKPGVKGLTLAQQAGILTMVINHKDYKNREEFDTALHDALTEHNIDIVCLAGFMRILTGGFVRKWTGRMLNVHPSLLPSFKGANAHEQVLASRVCISGCTVHFVAEEVDAGAILVQESVPVYPDDTQDTLSERIKLQEHRAFPRALELVTSGRAVLGETGHIVWA